MTPSIRPISPSNPDDKAAHDELVRLVDRRRVAKRGGEGQRSWPGMLELHKRRSRPSRSGALAFCNTDAKIDEIVYRLYGVTDEERKIIEGAK